MFGKDYTDRLAAFTLRLIVDSPEEDADPDFDLYFYRKLEVADSIVDSDDRKMGKMRSIIEASGISLRPKSSLSFAARAKKNPDGDLAILLTVSNKSPVGAKHAQVQFYVSPDMQLLHEPVGAARDQSTTLKSARVVTFDSIPAGSRSEIEIDFRPFPKPIALDPVLGLRYSCASCCSDTYDHSLGFKFSATK